MAQVLRPKRALQSKAETLNPVLAKGEMLLVYSDSDYGTNVKSINKIYVGDGASSFSQLKPFIQNNTGYGKIRNKNLGTINNSIEANDFVSKYGINTGEFKDIEIGDEFIIKDGTYNATWLVAGFNHYKNKGDTALTANHIVAIPKTYITTSKMNSSNTTTGGYYNSYMHQTTIPTINTNLSSVLGSHYLKRRALLSNSVRTDLPAAGMDGVGFNSQDTIYDYGEIGVNNDGSGTAPAISNNWAWYDVYACLMSETEVYGCAIASSSIYDIGEACEKLPIFNLINHVYFGRNDFWLRSVASSAWFALAANYGRAFFYYASGVIGVRPTITIG